MNISCLCCTYCFIEIKNRDIFMADDKAFCSNSHRDLWNITKDKSKLPNLKINTQKHRETQQYKQENKQLNKPNSPTPSVSANSMITYFLQTLLK